MTQNFSIDLKKEQVVSLTRPRFNYSMAARFFFLTMDLLTGRKTTLAKAKLIETLASIPYRTWEIRQYARLTKEYRNQKLVEEAQAIMNWGREAQDNEYWHLLIINEKMKQDNIRDPWYLYFPIPFIMVCSYVMITKMMAFFNIRRAFLFNAEFEDHAEHVYARFVEDHPEWGKQPVNSELVKQYGSFDNWADVFMRIGLDERDHMNHSFALCGKPESIARYDGMPETAARP